MQATFLGSGTEKLGQSWSRARAMGTDLQHWEMLVKLAAILGKRWRRGCSVFVPHPWRCSRTLGSLSWEQPTHSRGGSRWALRSLPTNPTQPNHAVIPRSCVGRMRVVHQHMD